MGLHDLSEEEGHDDAQEHLLPQNTDSSKITFSRRNALKALGALFVAGSASAQEKRFVPATKESAPDEAEEKEDENLVDLPQALRDAQEAVKEKGFHVINHAWSKENRDEIAVRLPSVVPPTGYTLMPVIISTLAKAVKGGKVLLPCPRDIIDQLHAGCQVEVVQKSGSFDGFKVEIVNSTSEESGYRNPCIIIEFTETGPTVEARVLHWVVTPRYPQVSKEQVLQALDPVRRQAVWAAVTAAAQLPYRNTNTMDIKEIIRNGTGDCAAKAVLARYRARQLGQSCVEYVGGYVHRSPQDALYRGGHAINFVAGTNGAFTFDGGSPESYTIGPIDKFTPTSVGTSYKFDDVSGFGTYSTISSGKYYRTKLETRSGESISKASHSIPGFGDYGAPLMRTRPSPEVVRYAEELWAFRQSAYGVDPRLAQRP